MSDTVGRRPTPRQTLSDTECLAEVRGSETASLEHFAFCGMHWLGGGVSDKDTGEPLAGVRQLVAGNVLGGAGGDDLSAG